MEKKERYELIGYCSYRDTETGVIGDNFVELLNQQDKLIKELKGKMLILWKIKEEKSSMNNLYFNHETLRSEPIIEPTMVEKDIKQLEEEVEKLRAIVKGKVLMVEDGSVDIDKLEEDGFYVIVYRNGATPPQYLKD